MRSNLIKLREMSKDAQWQCLGTELTRRTMLQPQQIITQPVFHIALYFVCIYMPLYHDSNILILLPYSASELCLYLCRFSTERNSVRELNSTIVCFKHSSFAHVCQRILHYNNVFLHVLPHTPRSLSCFHLCTIRLSYMTMVKWNVCNGQ